MQPDFKEWLIKERLKYSLKGRFLVRFHATLILLGAVIVGWSANRLLFMSGVENMIIRFPAGVLAAYWGFLIGIELWIRYSGINEYLNSRRSKELLDPDGFKPPALKDPWIFPDGGVPLVDGEGCLIVLLVLFAVVLVFAMGGYLIFMAGDLFADVVFELLLVAGLIRGIRRVDAFGFTGGIPKVTLPALAVVLAVSVVVGFWARHFHPEAKTLAEALKAEKASYHAAKEAGKQFRRR